MVWGGVVLGGVEWGGVGWCGVWWCGVGWCWVESSSTGPRNKTNRTLPSVALGTVIMPCRSTNDLHVCSEPIIF